MKVGAMSGAPGASADMNSSATNASDKADSASSGKGSDFSQMLQKAIDIIKTILKLMEKGLSGQDESGKGQKDGGGGGGGDTPSCGGGGGGGGQNGGGPQGADGGGAPGGSKGAGESNGAGGGGGGNKALIAEINRVRAEHGLKPVTEASNLDRAASQNDAAQQKQGIGHHVPLGNNGASGEIAFQASNGADAKNSVQGWLNSLAHREILLNPNLTKVGADINGQFSTADFS